MDFQPSNLWIFIKFFNNLWDNISCLKGVDNRVCFSARDTVEISYHYLCVVIIYLHISHFSPPSTHHMMNAEHQDHATSHHINVQHSDNHVWQCCLTLLLTSLPPPPSPLCQPPPQPHPCPLPPQTTLQIATNEPHWAQMTMDVVWAPGNLFLMLSSLLLNN